MSVVVGLEVVDSVAEVVVERSVRVDSGRGVVVPVVVPFHGVGLGVVRQVGVVEGSRLVRKEMLEKNLLWQ